MNTMTYNGYSARIEYDDDDGIFFGKIAGIGDSVSFHADNVIDLKQAFAEAVDDYLETCATIGKSPEKPYSGKMMVRISPAIHAKAAKAAELAGISLNQWTEQTLDKAVTG